MILNALSRFELRVFPEEREIIMLALGEFFSNNLDNKNYCAISSKFKDTLTVMTGLQLKTIIAALKDYGTPDAIALSVLIKEAKQRKAPCEFCKEDGNE